MIAETVAIVLFCRAFVAANRDEASATDISLALIAAIGFMATRAVEAVGSDRMLFEPTRNGGNRAAQPRDQSQAHDDRLRAQRLFPDSFAAAFRNSGAAEGGCGISRIQELHRAVMLVIDNAVDWMNHQFREPVRC